MSFAQYDLDPQYQLLDSGHFLKLESVGPYRIVRPSPSAVWKPRLSEIDWRHVDAVFHRHADGDGEWKINNKKINVPWSLSMDEVTFQLKLTSFGHLGIFPEQRPNWLQLEKIVRDHCIKKGACRVLNLFAYTGGSSLYCARAGAEVTHVDASKGSVKWAQDNAQLSGLSEKPVRWLVDDVQEFVAREVRRSKTYHGIILDPPSYGRGHKNQMWKIEEHLLPFMDELKKVMDPQFSFLLMSSHSPGYTPMALRNLCQQICGNAGTYLADEMLIPEKGSERTLPSGAYCLFTADK